MKGWKIAIVGSGSIGLYYGAHLAAAGYDVSFLMRSGLKEATEKGIHVSSPAGDVHVEKPKVFGDVQAIGPVDLVIISLKATSNTALETLIPPLLKENTLLLTLQNGLGNEEYLAQHFGAERVLGGLCFICLTRTSPASVNHVSTGKLSLGEFGRTALPRTREITDAFTASGINVTLVDNLVGERWRKLVWNIPFNGLSVAEGGVTVDQILADPALFAECRALMDETIAAANAHGHPIETDYADFQINRTHPMGAYKPSTLVDWLAGSELEIEPIWGEPLRRANAAGVEAPHLRLLYERLKAINLRK